MEELVLEELHMHAPADADALRLIEVARYRVVFADCDLMRIMYFASYLRLLEIGRAELFRRLGHPFPTYIARGLYLAVVEARCRYLKPARYDDELTIRAGLTEVKRATLTIAYEIVGPACERCVSAFTVHAVLDEGGRPQRIPAEFAEAARTAMAQPAAR
jgi:acyl-CoA thioester hydrolase